MSYPIGYNTVPLNIYLVYIEPVNINQKQLYLRLIKLTFLIYCYENGYGVLKMINKSYKNKNNGLVYMINEQTKIQQQHQFKKTRLRSKQGTTKCSIKKRIKQVNSEQQHCKLFVYIYRNFAKTKTVLFKCIYQTTQMRQKRQNRTGLQGFRKISVILV